MLTTNPHQIFERQKILGAILVLEEMERASQHYQELADLLRNTFLDPEDDSWKIPLSEQQQATVKIYLKQFESGAERYAVSEEYSASPLLRQLRSSTSLDDLEPTLDNVVSMIPGGKTNKLYKEWIRNHSELDFREQASYFFGGMHVHKPSSTGGSGREWHRDREHILLRDLPRDALVDLSTLQEEKIVVTIMRDLLSDISNFRDSVYAEFYEIYESETNWNGQCFCFRTIAEDPRPVRYRAIKTLAKRFGSIVDEWDTKLDPDEHPKARKAILGENQFMSLSDFVGSLFDPEKVADFHYLRQSSGEVYKFFERQLLQDLEQTIS